MKCLKLALLTGFFVCIAAARATDADNVAILLYHHVSESTPASTSVTPEVFEEHLKLLADGFTVISLETAVEALRAGKKLPDRAVVITFDDGYRNIYDNAHPLLVRFGFPYTVFVNPPMIGQYQYQLNWEQVLAMSREGAQFANHTAQHDHLLERAAGETEQSWLARIEQDIVGSEKALEEQIGYSLGYLAYPYGEFDENLRGLIVRLGFTGFGQQSGAVSSQGDFAALPRFPAAGIYANPKSLKVKMNSLAMPVTSTSVSSPVVPSASDIESFSFEFARGDLSESQLRCYFGATRAPVSVLGGVATVTVPGPIPVGRSRVNCTAPSRENPGRYYWYSQPWFKSRVNGTYPE